MSIEKAVYDMLFNGLGYKTSMGGTAPTSDPALPKLTFEVTNVERADLSGQWQAELEVRVIANDVDSALLAYVDLPPTVVPGTYAGIPITSAIHTGRVIEPPEVGEGSERGPTELVARWNIIYTE
jgi:hypothetical protein